MTDSVASSVLEHLAIIPDGNRRWSRLHRQPLEETYFNSCAKMLSICRFLNSISGLREVSLFFVSLQNLLRRRREELDPLFRAGHHFLDVFYEQALNDEIDLRWVGMHQKADEVDSLEHVGFRKRVWELPRSMPRSRRLNVVIGYDVRCDIEESLRGNRRFDPGKLQVSRPVDLVVRSGGRRRLSGFLPLVCQYAEFDFLEMLFPDVEVEDIAKSLRRFREENRLFGS